MTIEQMMEKKREMGFSCEELSKISGVPLATVQKIFSGMTRSPRRKTIVKLEEAFYKSSGSEQGGVRYPEYDQELLLSAGEGAVEYGKKDLFDKSDNSHTVEEYLSLPDDMRVELIDGTFYEMYSPTYEHQEILMSIAMELRTFVKKNNGKCKVLPAPFDIQLNKDNKTMVQPDVVVICEKDRINKNRGYGAPDMVVEILSPSTTRKDWGIKLAKYLEAGVREYWIVDPKNRIIVVYFDEAEDSVFPTIYNFDSQVPVHIWDGKCKVDFSKIDTEL